MKLKFQYHELKLNYPFTISRSSSIVKPSIIVELEHEGIIGYGEAAPSERYGENKDTVQTFLSSLDLTQLFNPFLLEDILEYVEREKLGNTAAKTAIDIALYDWIGKKLGIPLWKYFGLNKNKTPITSYTIGIDSVEMIERKVIEAEKYSILKVKVGVHNDIEIIKTIRKLTNKTLRVDANEGWKSKEEALNKILWLEEQGIEFVEQPLPADRIDDMVWLKERVHIPLIADESVMSFTDIPKLWHAFDGINIKLMKCSGLHKATRIIHTARALDMKVMLGCMIESSVGISAAAQISPMVDYADLDGNLLINNDPFTGVNVKNGKLILNDLPGLGIKLK